MKILVLDFGGTFIKYSVMDELKNVLDEGGEVPAPIDTLEHFKEVIAEMYAPYKGQVDGVTISFPGFITKGTTQLTGGGAYLNILKDYYLKDVFAECIDVPLAIENDGKCGALAEAWGGALDGAESGVVYIIGTGIAGGLLHEGKIISGKHGTAGELSYLGLDWTMNPFNISQFRCSASMLVAKASMAKGIELKNFAAMYNNPAVSADWKHGEPDPAFDGVEMDGKKVFELLAEGDPDITEMYNQFCNDIAAVMLNLQIVYDPETIAIGGGMCRQDRLVKDIQAAVDAQMQGLLAMLPRPNLVRCHYMSSANQYGAMYNFLQTYYPEYLNA